MMTLRDWRDWTSADIPDPDGPYSLAMDMAPTARGDGKVWQAVLVLKPGWVDGGLGI